MKKADTSLIVRLCLPQFAVGLFTTIDISKRPWRKRFSMRRRYPLFSRRERMQDGLPAFPMQCPLCAL